MVEPFGAAPSIFIDPDEDIDMLPQPFRMISHVLENVIEDALDSLSSTSSPGGGRNDVVSTTPAFTMNIPEVLSITHLSAGVLVFAGTSTGDVRVINALRGRIQSTVTVEASSSITFLQSFFDRVLIAITSTGNAVFYAIVPSRSPYIIPYAKATLPNATKASMSKDLTRAVLIVANSASILEVVALPKELAVAETADDEADEEKEAAIVDALAALAKLPPALLRVVHQTTVAGDEADVQMTYAPCRREMGQLPSSFCDGVVIFAMGGSKWRRLIARGASFDRPRSPPSL